MSSTTVTFIDTISALQQMLCTIKDLPTSPPSLYLDLEGVKLSRYGSVSILTFHISTAKKTYLIDIHTLGAAAFSTVSKTADNDNTAISIKSILESATIPKVFFDVRNDSDALFTHYNIDLKGVHDVQLIELAARRGNKTFVCGLAKCIQSDAPLSQARKVVCGNVKKTGRALFAPEQGGRYEVFNERPMQKLLVDYCALDVEVLPLLWGVYNGKLDAAWSRKLVAATEDRVIESQSPGYNPDDREKSRGPWGFKGRN
ncbi:hypothetical protein EJ08DRAFT_632234 [Tothia fuscella]|uniref:3'-5' exonuclease domain-containing protein n=1 Tax=Tothia fuscella TaxID=1048955 RepID=A0A9P4NTD1_9PEZI|nr:hypothetical protein EJ08DRAFT_632234 [Tothia fuscella]